MSELDRRRFLQLAGGGLAASALAQTFGESIARAAAIPASRRHGSLRDVEHIVVLMQENRSFDHYLGTMRGVRGFGDPHPAVLPSGRSVWHQSDGTREVLPYRPDHDDLGMAFLEGTPHGWPDTHEAFHDGHYDRFVPAKTQTTMTHLRRGDMPFQFALGDAFTVCDGYHCSTMTSTDPNRYYMWTGWVGNDGAGKGPVVTNAEAGYAWTTYPERLERAGVSWKIYQDVGTGLDAAGSWGWTDDAYIGNYGDNSLLYFDNYRNARPGDALYEKARRGTNAAAGDGYFDILRADVAAGRLPQISWIAAPEAFCEHPNWPVNYGAWYVSQVLDALTSDPDVWSKTVLLVTYDENDGYFDHVVPPYPNTDQLAGASTVPTVDEVYRGTEFAPAPYGLGQRVPMFVVSPWSTGGWVCSETFDHTSIIRLMEARFGVREPNITPWRRAVCGDLTSAFDFSRHRAAAPDLPSTAGYRPPDRARHDSFVPVPPEPGRLPSQEAGVRPSRPLGYRLDVSATVRDDGLALAMRNAGRLGVHLQARSQTGAAPVSFTVGAKDSLTASLPVSGRYDIALHGPHGFFRRFAGDAADVDTEAWVTTHGDRIELVLVNRGRAAVTFRVADAYGRARTVRVRGRDRVGVRVSTERQHGWYDLTVTHPGTDGFRRAMAGRVETGRPSVSDPQLSGR
ncbi:phospholipase C [Jatrophihabitans endophyticus]|uniref:phospholipase C n=1 Tax=Jatrophihabitans endophyticus TaxID=1206085 RepID=A0A1M5TB03_9ACTN|nr:phospholipase C, phosphocholine-specific [Jatrophihabitans endophyticus]SHH47881.1 phospholipase C [Jatrophihabitans endophyticus]